jgi:hypothetical protein
MFSTPSTKSKSLKVKPAAPLVHSASSLQLGGLRLVNQQSSGGSGPCHLALMDQAGSCWSLTMTSEVSSAAGSSGSFGCAGSI